ncbi:hypothetical protein O6H91_11G013300 [Diphasiastrum complanatum]|uniref:Uncharacterized protein n=1 Tax=Diphasiastrum complanatum TaxID=34168 RepID=A0ACC2C6K8_DIPCM|nr:hypothetical protein O6H91_Y060000 [Diphasiastrum complanatum]KAJ7537605.1 hypothetical protein O6H91_11G013300 [Diphasiastrum complanatum]
MRARELVLCSRSEKMECSGRMWSFLVLLSFVLAFRYAVALNDVGLGKGEEGNWGKQRSLSTVVEGYVYCHECAHNDSRWIKSIPDALVSVMCRDRQTGHVTSYGDAKTNAKGFYQIKLPDHNPLVHGTGNCKARLLVSTDDSCNLIANTGNGKLGADLILRKVYYDEVFFKAAPFAFMPYYCHSRDPRF